MSNYEEMYYTLFNAITDAITELQSCKPLEAIETLKTAQQKTEEQYMQKDES